MKVYKTKEYYITAQLTGDYLTAGEDGLVVVQPQDAQAAQLWKFVPEADGSYRVLNVQTKKVLDIIDAGNVDGAWTHLWGSADSASQLWKMEEEGETVRFCSVHSGKYLDVALEDNTHVQIWEKGGDNQLWKVVAAEKPKAPKKESTAIKEKEPSAIKPHEKGAIKEKEPSAIKPHEKGVIKPTGKTQRKPRNKKTGK